MTVSAARSFVIGTLALGLGGCPGANNGDAVPLPSSYEKVTPTMTSRPNPVPAQVMERILDDISRESGVARSDLVVERAEQVTWNDGALGCPQPNVEYLQAIVQGFWVVVHAGQQEFDYRIDDRSRYVRCTGATRQAPIVYPPDR
jgi:hypothetical protein